MTKDTHYDYEANEFKFLGWVNDWDAPADLDVFGTDGQSPPTPPAYRVCRSSGHNRDEVRHSIRGSENTVSCDTCKVYWKYDSSG
jgi:hypothetical protein